MDNETLLFGRWLAATKLNREGARRWTCAPNAEGSQTWHVTQYECDKENVPRSTPIFDNLTHDTALTLVCQLSEAWAEQEARDKERAASIFDRASTKGEKWKAMIAAMHAGTVVEIDEAMYWRWLEVIPPVYQLPLYVTIGGERRLTSFGFAEGSEPVTVFWHETTVTGATRYFCQRGPWEDPDAFKVAHEYEFLAARVKVCIK